MVLGPSSPCNVLTGLLACTTTDWPHLHGLVHLPLPVARGDARGAEGHHRGPHWQDALRAPKPATSLCLFFSCHVSHSHGQPYRLVVIIFFHRYEKKNHLGIHLCGPPSVTCPGAPCSVPVTTLACLLGNRHRTDATVVVRRRTEYVFTQMLHFRPPWCRMDRQAPCVSQHLLFPP